MRNVISLIEKKQEARVDSNFLSEHLHIQHKNLLALVDANKSEFEEFGQLAFQTRVNSKKGAGQATRYALLNEDQSYFLLRLTRNTDHTKQLKVELIKAFSRFRNHQQDASDYLPYYHDLHDSVALLANHAHAHGSNTNSRVFHININKLINKAFNLESGQRSDLPGTMRVKVTNANVTAHEIIDECVRQGVDHHETYQKVKCAVYAFANTAIRLEHSKQLAREALGEAK